MWGKSVKILNMLNLWPPKYATVRHRLMWLPPIATVFCFMLVHYSHIYWKVFLVKSCSHIPLSQLEGIMTAGSVMCMTVTMETHQFALKLYIQSGRRLFIKTIWKVASFHSKCSNKMIEDFLYIEVQLWLCSNSFAFTGEILFLIALISFVWRVFVLILLFNLILV